MSDPVFLHPQNLFVGHGYLQRTGAENLEHVYFRYHVFMILDDYDLQDSIVFTYQWRLGIVIEETAEEKLAREDQISL